MAKSRRTTEPVISELVVEKEKLKNKLVEREEQGKQLFNRNITNAAEKQATWTEFMDWNHYNEELIKQAFNVPDNEYFKEYKYTPRIDLEMITNPYKEKTFQEYVNDDKDAIQWQLTKLHRFIDKIELLRSQATVIPTEDNRKSFKQLVHLLTRFHKVAQALRDRYNERETILIKDEYDVQDLSNGLLQIHFADVRKEDASPSHAGSNSRIDFVLKNERIILEIKMTSEKYPTKKLGEDLLVDIGRYKAYPDCNDLVIFIYDKGDHVRNKQGFITDLEKHSTPAMKVTVIINPD